jgi:hypothetical protein
MIRFGGRYIHADMIETMTLSCALFCDRCSMAKTGRTSLMEDECTVPCVEHNCSHLDVREYCAIRNHFPTSESSMEGQLSLGNQQSRSWVALAAAGRCHRGSSLPCTNSSWRWLGYANISCSVTHLLVNHTISIAIVHRSAN